MLLPLLLFENSPLLLVLILEGQKRLDKIRYHDFFNAILRFILRWVKRSKPSVLIQLLQKQLKHGLLNSMLFKSSIKWNGRISTIWTRLE